MKLIIHICLSCPPPHSDLSHNQLSSIGRRIFKGATSIKSLQFDNNEITCVDEQALKGMGDLEIL